MTRLSNRLTDLADRVSDAAGACRAAERSAAEKAIEAGSLLVEAKAECKHGEWLPFIERAGVPERQAQRLMKLARSGLKSDTVSYLGGIKAALAWAATLKEIPEGARVLAVRFANETAAPNDLGEADFRDVVDLIGGYAVLDENDQAAVRAVIDSMSDSGQPITTATVSDHWRSFVEAIEGGCRISPERVERMLAEDPNLYAVRTLYGVNATLTGYARSGPNTVRIGNRILPKAGQMVEVWEAVSDDDRAASAFIFQPDEYPGYWHVCGLRLSSDLDECEVTRTRKPVHASVVWQTVDAVLPGWGAPEAFHISGDNAREHLEQRLAQIGRLEAAA